MLNKKLEKAFNEQINAEMYSSYLYMAMSAYCEYEGMEGFAHWMRLQAQEEMSHTQRFYDYIHERGGRVIFKAIAQPPSEWSNVTHVFKEVLAHEQKVTELVNNLVDLAIEKHDHASNIFLQWFVSEQVEEEASVGKVLAKLNLVKGDPGSIFAIDQELSTRTFTPAP